MTSARDWGLTVVGMSGGEELVLCPFHSDSNASAWFDPKKELFYCAVCSMGMNGAMLAQKLGVEVESGFIAEEPDDYNLVGDKLRMDSWRPLFHNYFSYRNLSIPIAAKYHLQWSWEEPEAAVLPFTDYSGNIIGATYRYLHPEISGTRYKIFGRRTPVWPLHIVSGFRGRTHTLITEGGWSAMRIATVAANAGLDINCLSLLGAKANTEIVEMTRHLDPIFLYDNDRAGRTACAKMRSLAPTLHSFTLAKAPDDMSDLEILELLDRITVKIYGVL